MRHKYLREIGIKSFPDNHFGGPVDIRSFFNHVKYSLERKFTGIDHRDCWDMDVTFYQWLYERLQVFLEDAGKIIDLDCISDDFGFDYNGKKYSLREMVVMLSDKLKEMLTFDDSEEAPENNLIYEYIENEDGSTLHKCISSKEEEKEYYEKLNEYAENSFKHEKELRHQIFEIFELNIFVKTSIYIYYKHNVDNLSPP